MLVTQEAQEFINRHLRDFDDPVLVIYDQKVNG